ncbi:MAG: hypothetical protein ACRERD_33670, partial [Candidatus Binatia bacterium]
MQTPMHIAELTASTLTRLRGEMAGRQVAASAQAEAVELDFGQTSVSLSFLDGLVLTLQGEHLLHRVTFVTANPVVYSRLARIAGERSVTIGVSLRPGEAHTSAASAPVRHFELDEHLE